MPLDLQIRYCTKVAFTAALVSPLLYLALAGAYAANDTSAAVIWALSTMGIGCVIAVPALLLLYGCLVVFRVNKTNLTLSRLTLSASGVGMCALAMIGLYGWQEFDTIYYKLFVTYSTVSICAVWLYPLHFNSA